MATPVSKAFIVDCPWCKAKVAATESGRAEQSGFNEEVGEPYAYKILVGLCPSCGSILAGQTEQTGFENFDAQEDRWSDVVRIYPKPPKAFSSYRIPRVVKDSLNEADRSLQAGANIAACVMLGRALEALCRDVLEPLSGSAASAPEDATAAKSKKKIMLGKGIKALRDNKIIDDRLFDWSQQLHAFRNLAAHPEDISISRDDAEDLQTLLMRSSTTSTILLTAMRSSKAVLMLVQSARSPNQRSRDVRVSAPELKRQGVARISFTRYALLGSACPRSRGLRLPHSGTRHVSFGISRPFAKVGDWVRTGRS